MAVDPTEIQIDADRRKKLDALARQNGASPSDIVAAAIDDYSRDRLHNSDAENETLYDIAKRRGAIGLIKGGPRDLSTNPKYLEGFGEDG